MSSPRFQRIAILGLGLLGGSVALAARRAGVARTVVAAGRRPAPLQRARDRGVVDDVADVRGAVAGADLVVLATPVGVMARVLEEAAPALAPGVLVTDVGSVKGMLADRLTGLLPAGTHYVGAHPMAGSHEVGVDHARADLFEGARCVITAGADTDPEARARVAAFWSALGADVVERDPDEHDEQVAWVSHVPHAVAFAYAHALAGAPRCSGEIAGGGFRDFTRIARSDVALWSEILEANRKAVSGPLQRVARSLTELAAAIEAGDSEAIESFLSSANEQLAEAHAMAPFGGSDGDGENARSGGAIPEIQAGPERPATPRSVVKTHE